MHALFCLFAFFWIANVDFLDRQCGTSGPPTQFLLAKRAWCHAGIFLSPSVASPIINSLGVLCVVFSTCLPFRALLDDVVVSLAVHYNCLLNFFPSLLLMLLCLLCCTTHLCSESSFLFDISLTHDIPLSWSPQLSCRVTPPSCLVSFHFVLVGGVVRYRCIIKCV